MEAVADVMEEKYFTLFMWALGTIVALCGVIGSVFQLYIISKFNHLQGRVKGTEDGISKLQDIQRECEHSCESKRRELKCDIYNHFEK